MVQCSLGRESEMIRCGCSGFGGIAELSGAGSSHPRGRRQQGQPEPSSEGRSLLAHVLF